MTLPTTDDSTIAQTRRVLAKVESDMEERRRRRIQLANEMNTNMMLPGFF